MKRVNPLQNQIERIKEDMAIADAKLEMRRIDPTTYRTIISDLESKVRGAQRKQRELDPMNLKELDSMKLKSLLLGHGFNELWLRCLNGFVTKLEETPQEEVLRLTYEDMGFVTDCSSHNLMKKYSMATFVYPDYVELKGSLPIEIIRQSNVSAGCRSARYRQSR